MADFAGVSHTNPMDLLIQLSANEWNLLEEKCKNALQSLDLISKPQLGKKISTEQITETNLSRSAKNNTLTPQQIAPYIDDTLLKADATPKQIIQLCKEADEYGFATVCVNSVYLSIAAEILKNSKTKPIAVVGFPLGATLTTAKCFEAKAAITQGAQEIDMVLPIGLLKSGNWKSVYIDIASVVEASKPFPVKVILETCLLTDAEKVAACVLSREAGAAFVKTSTGFSTAGATTEDIALMRFIVGSEMGVKASGGIRTTQDALNMITSGADRIGASASIQIVQNKSGHTKNGY